VKSTVIAAYIVGCVGDSDLLDPWLRHGEFMSVWDVVLKACGDRRKQREGLIGEGKV
jgi:hypothetical protein